MVSTDGENGLEFYASWSMVDIDLWLRRLLPKAFEWLDACRGVMDFHWVLLNTDRLTHFILTRPTITGKELDEVKGTSRKFTSYSIAIGTFYYSHISTVPDIIIISKLPGSPFRAPCIPTGMQLYGRHCAAATPLLAWVRVTVTLLKS